MAQMKSIAIVTENYADTLGVFLRKNLLRVLEGYAEVTCYYLDKFPVEDRIRQDAVLVMTREMGVNVSSRTSDAKKIVAVSRTIGKDELDKLFSIPSGTRVLVVNDNAETTLEMVSLLLHIGIDHLDLVPFDPELDYDDIKIAITPGERLFVPKHIASVIDTGHRFIDISTFVLLIEMLGISGRTVNQRLLDYSGTIVPLETGINSQYRQLFVRNLEMDSILGLTHEGIVLLDNDGRVRMHSKAVQGMLGLEGDIGGSLFSEKIDPGLHDELGREPVFDRPVQYRGKSLLVTARRMEQFGERSGTFYNFRDITYLSRLERRIDERTRDSGFVARYCFDDMVTESSSMQACIALARRFAGADFPVLIHGESGTGKELLAHSLHSASARARGPFVAFNCAAMPESLIESELFGYEAGSFTGALKSGKPGLFEQADKGTIFLDEIGDMPVSLQSRLLRVLQERVVMRLGSKHLTAVDIRVIAATNQDLEERMAQGSFRPDLYYRLNVLPLPVPPLRERVRDIVLLLQSFLATVGKGNLHLEPETAALLERYSWPGNIRELWNVASYVSVLSTDSITVDDLPRYLRDRVQSAEGAAIIIPNCRDPADTGIADFGAIQAALEKAGELDTAVFVLSLLPAPGISTGAAGAGRNNLVIRLAKEGIQVSSGRMRRILSLLAREGLTIAPSGRGGSRVSVRGGKFLRWYKNGLPK